MSLSGLDETVRCYAAPSCPFFFHLIHIYPACSTSSAVAVSDSQGCVSIVDLGDSGPTLAKRWKAHQFEAWIVACGCDEHTVFSGGDDCRLCCWDTRENPTKPTLVSKRYHHSTRVD